MIVQFGKCSDIDGWMSLVEEISWNFPGLETREKIDGHRQTVLHFISKEQALCAKNDNKEIIGVLLFSRSHNMICCLGVSPAHRRYGVASCLLSKALEQLDRAYGKLIAIYRARGDYKTINELLMGSNNEQILTTYQNYIAR